MAGGEWATPRGAGIVLTDGLPEVRLSNAPKYHNRRTWSELCQREFASKAECQRGEHLHMLELAGEITNLEYQPQWPLSKHPYKVTYTADFRYHQRDGDGQWETIVEDVKGVLTEATRVRIAWLSEKYHVTVRLVGGGRDPIGAS